MSKVITDKTKVLFPFRISYYHNQNRMIKLKGVIGFIGKIYLN